MKSQLVVCDEIHHAVLGKKRLRSLSQQQYNSEFGLPFWVITVLK